MNSLWNNPFNFRTMTSTIWLWHWLADHCTIFVKWVFQNPKFIFNLFNFQARKDEHFSMGTAIGAAIQTLEAIQELHSIGYLHRDIKPGNYSIGRPERRGEVRKIYILDFGMCRSVFLIFLSKNLLNYFRRYIRPDGTMRRPRAAAGFRGTPRYAALRCHQVMILNFTIK